MNKNIYKYTQFQMIATKTDVSRINGKSIPYLFRLGKAQTAEEFTNPVEIEYYLQYTSPKDTKPLREFTLSDLKDPQIVKSSNTVTHYNPFFATITSQTPTSYINIQYENLKIGRPRISVYILSDPSPLVWEHNQKQYYIDTHTYADSSSDISLDFVKTNKEISTEVKQLQQELFKEYSKNEVSYVNKHSNYKYEIKSQFSPYNHIELKTTGSEIYKISKQNTTTKQPTFITGYGFLLETNNHFAYSETINNVYIKNDPNTNNAFIENLNYSLPTGINALEEFLIRNKSQQNAGWLNKGIGLATGALGIAGAAFTGGASLGVTALAGASLAAHSASGIIQQLAQRKDIKNTPDKLANVGSTFLADDLLKGFYLKSQEYKLPPFELNLINQHFFKYGYNINNNLYNINDYLKTRYYFNYIEVPESFENIKLQASAEIKQIINDTLAAGVTIWNVRDLQTFKGIKNYEYENMEMSLIPQIKRKRNSKKKGK